MFIVHIPSMIAWYDRDDLHMLLQSTTSSLLLSSNDRGPAVMLGDGRMLPKECPFWVAFIRGWHRAFNWPVPATLLVRRKQQQMLVNMALLWKCGRACWIWLLALIPGGQGGSSACVTKNDRFINTLSTAGKLVWQCMNPPVFEHCWGSGSQMLTAISKPVTQWMNRPLNHPLLFISSTKPTIFGYPYFDKPPDESPTSQKRHGISTCVGNIPWHIRFRDGFHHENDDLPCPKHHVLGKLCKLSTWFM